MYCAKIWGGDILCYKALYLRGDDAGLMYMLPIMSNRSDSKGTSGHSIIKSNIFVDTMLGWKLTS